MIIRYIKNEEIDKKRWDQLINDAPNGRIYAYSWYLDIVARKWDALIGGDYEFVMPLPLYSRYCITYSTTPYFVQQLGIFSLEKISIEQLYSFLEKIPSKIKYLNLNVNLMETFSYKGIKSGRSTNYILDISRPYDEIKSGYKSDALKKLKKENSFRLIETEDIEDVVQNYQDWNGHLVPFTENDYDRMLRLMKRANQEKHLITCQLLDANNEVNASGFFLTSHGRAYHIAASQSPTGRQNSANHFFIDKFIQTYSQSVQIFDFEGSNIPGVAQFFKKWGSIPEYYTNIQFARFPINLIR